MERHDEEKPYLLFPQPVFDRADQGLAGSLPVMVRIDAQPIDFRADGAVPLEQQQAGRPVVNPRNPGFQDFRLLGVMAVGFVLTEPFRQACCQSFQKLPSAGRVFFLTNENVHAKV